MDITKYEEYLDKYQIPSRIKEKFDILPEEEKKYIIEKVELNKKKILPAFLYDILLLASSGYCGNWFSQVIFWFYTLIMISIISSTGSLLMSLVLGGSYVFRLLRIPTLVKRTNRNLFLKFFSKRVHKHQLSKNSTFNLKKVLKNQYDPMNITVHNLKKGYILDFDTTTWEVIETGQYQWEEYDEKYFIIQSDTIRKYLFHKYHKNTENRCDVLVADIVEDVDITSQCTLERGKYIPIQEILLQSEWMIRYKFDKGHFFKGSEDQSLLKCWKYKNHDFTKAMRIEKYKDNMFKVYMGKKVSSDFFTSILPKTS